MKTVKWFANCTSVEGLKKTFRRLAMKHHPDRGGDVTDMQEINEEYQFLLKSFDGQTTTTDDGKTYTYRYDANIEKELMDKIYELLALNLIEVEVILIGVWIWVIGNTRPHKQALKAAKCCWHSKRKCWYWQNSPDKRRRYSKQGLGQIARKYGSTHFDNTDKPAQLADSLF